MSVGDFCKHMYRHFVAVEIFCRHIVNLQFVESCWNRGCYDDIVVTIVMAQALNRSSRLKRGTLSNPLEY